MKEKCCGIIASPPLCFPWGYDEEDDGCGALKIILFNHISLLRSEGLTEFAVVMDSGLGLYAAEIINALRENDPAIQLTCILPWEEQATKWTPELRERYFKELVRCSNVSLVSTVQKPDSQISAMLNAIDMADTIIAIEGEGNMLLSVALRYAEQMRKHAVLI